MAGSIPNTAPFVGDTEPPTHLSAYLIDHRFENGVFYPSSRRDFQKALGLRFEKDDLQAKDSLKQLFVTTLAQVPEYLPIRVTMSRLRAGKISQDRAAQMGATGEGCQETDVLEVVLSSDPAVVRLVHTPYQQLSEQERKALSPSHLCARVIHAFHSTFTANSASRNHNHTQLRNDLPSPWDTFRLRSDDFDQFKDKYSAVENYQADMADSDRYWTLLVKLVSFLNRQFHHPGMLKIERHTVFHGDQITSIDGQSKFLPLLPAYNAFVATYPVP